MTWELKFSGDPIICTTRIDGPTVNTCDLFDAVEADRLKEEGMSRAVEFTAHEFLVLARAQAQFAAEHRPDGTATADDVALFKLGPAAGSIFKGKSWEFTGEWRKSTRVTNHGRMVRVWRLKT